MAKEIYISSTPHETRLAIVEDEQLTEIYYERENEYTLAGSIYKGKVTRVLPGMQSAFVEVGLERDAFLYVTDFLEEQDEPAEFERAPQQKNGGRGSTQGTAEPQAILSQTSATELPAVSNDGVTIEPAAASGTVTGEESAEGARRLRGRRGRRRGRGGRRDGAAVTTGSATGDADTSESAVSTPGVNTESGFEIESEDLIETDEFQAETVEFEEETQAGSVTPIIEASAATPRPSESRYPDRNADRGSGRDSGRQRQSSAQSATPVLLPGESLSRFRTAEQPAAHAAPAESSKSESPTPKASGHTLKPSTLIDSPIEWDGGLLLPGESLSRHRNQPTTSESATKSENVESPLVVDEELLEEELAAEPAQIAAALAEEHSHEPAEVATDLNTEDDSATHNVDPNPPSYFKLSSLFGGKKKKAEAGKAKSGKKSGPAFSAGTGLVEEEFDETDEDYDFSRIGTHAEDIDPDDLHEETLVSSGVIGQLVRDIHIEERTGAEDVDENGIARVARPAHTGTSGRERQGRRDGRSGDRGGERGGRGRRGATGGRKNTQNASLPVITELLKPGQEILVQIAKEPIAKKGARITSHIALPGRFLVFMPTVDHVGVSRRIGSDEERQRLKRILLSEKGEASGGFIVRTAAEGASEEELRSDLRFLIHLWNDIKQRSDSSKAPALIYHDLNLVERVLRDQVSDNFSAIWVDTEAEYERVVRFMQRFQPSLVRCVKLYSKQTPLFEQFGITEEINKALKTKVWLKSGGSIVINQTEALVAIDINTGKYVGKTTRLEDTIVKTNLDAIPEIVRQIRLRDLGGIIVIDFIDMDERRNRHKVLAALEEELKKDRAPSKVLQFNDFGLVAITRKRVKQSLERTLSTPCGTCTGTGMVKSAVTVCNEMYVELRKMHKQLERDDIMLRVHPEVVKELKSPQSHWLGDLEEMTGKTILVKSDPTLHPEQFDIH
jgi:ribonuclease G